MSLSCSPSRRSIIFDMNWGNDFHYFPTSTKNIVEVHKAFDSFESESAQRSDDSRDPGDYEMLGQNLRCWSCTFVSYCMNLYQN